MENLDLINEYRSKQPILTSIERKEGFKSKGLIILDGELIFHIDCPRAARHSGEYGEYGERMEDMMCDIDQRIFTFLEQINNETGIPIGCQAD